MDKTEILEYLSGSLSDIKLHFVSIFQILLCFSRDTGVLDKFRSSCSNAAKATLRGRTSPTPENTVIYPPNGIIPFHGFAMYCAPFAYVYEDPVQLYFTFRAFYLQFNSKLHEVSSDQHGIVSLCALFENLVRMNHLLPKILSRNRLYSLSREYYH